MTKIKKLILVGIVKMRELSLFSGAGLSQSTCGPVGSIRETEGTQQRCKTCRTFTEGWRNWPTEPDVGRVANGVPARVDRLKALGNAQVSRVAATAWRLLTEG